MGNISTDWRIVIVIVIIKFYNKPQSIVEQDLANNEIIKRVISYYQFFSVNRSLKFSYCFY